MFNGIGGSVEPGEAPVAAMNREWAEETGAARLEWKRFALLHSDDADIYFYRADADFFLYKGFVCSRSQYCGSPGEDVWFYRIDDLPNVISNLRWLIPMAAKSSRQDWPYEIIERSIE